jgi:hypothetical protein
VTRNTSPSLWIDPRNPAPWKGKAIHTHPKEHPMTTIKRLLRRLDGYTLEAFNAPATRARTRGRHSAR